MSRRAGLLTQARTVEIISRTRTSNVLTRSMTRGHSTIIQRTYNLIRELNYRTKRLIDLYRKNQGPPFNRPTFRPPSQNLPDLPELSHGEEEEEEEEEKETAWLRSDHKAYAGLVCYLTWLLEYQREVNPGRLTLLMELRYFVVNVGGLTINLESLLASLGQPRPKPGSCPDGWGPRSWTMIHATDWEKKLMGLEVCNRCARWLKATEEDFAALVSNHASSRVGLPLLSF